MTENINMKIMKKCPKCDWKILEIVSPASAKIEIKCPKCHRVVKLDLSFLRRSYAVK